MSTLSDAQDAAIRSYFAGRHIPSGIGTAEEACSVAGINLALTGRLSDEIPDCMSPVIGRWIIGIQDAMPDDMRNSDEWRELLPLAAGTGREPDAEDARLQILLAEMWRVLELVQPTADRHGFGGEWKHMLAERTAAAAEEAAAAVVAVAAAVVAVASRAASAVEAAARRTELTWAAEEAARLTARAVEDAARRSEAAAEAEALVAAAGVSWTAIDPIGTLRRLVGEGRATITEEMHQ